MKHYVTTVCVFTTTLIFLISICILTCSAKMTAFILEKQDSMVVSRSIEGLDSAEIEIRKDFEGKVFSASREAFFELTDILFNENTNVSEEEAVILYRKIARRILKEKYGIKVSDKLREQEILNESLKELLPELKTGDLSFPDDEDPYIELEDDRLYLKNVVVDYTYGNTYKREKEFDVSTKLTDIVFFDGNQELFEYSMVADKGIYVTGKTSTIIGNIYAGTHGPSELRKAEALYGESGSYGGLNIMSTQVAIDADKIVTDGNVNMRGAFVVFGNDQRPVSISAKDIIECDNVASKNIYALIGSLEDRDVSAEKMMANEAMMYFGSIEHYYDSDNDKTYTGKYRKLISSTDITVKNDVTGIIMTPGSVIIEEGVNVEGLIVSGDRIYIQGNNNIVSSVEILREMLREEFYGEIYMQEDFDTDEERALNSIHLYVSDYLGGIKRRGFVE